MVVCFSGHRPQNLPVDSVYASQIYSMLYSEIMECINSGCRRFISGLAAGIDLWAAEIVISLMEKYPDIELIGVMPYRAQSKALTGKWKQLYDFVSENCTELVCISEFYEKDIFRRRNYYMVDNSTHLIAVLKDFKSGTGQTVAYAKKMKKNVKIIRIAPDN